jgi:hypothetical protein
VCKFFNLMVGNSADHRILRETTMIMTKQNISTLRSKVQSAVRRADALTAQLCEMHPDPTSLAADITACVDLMLSDAVDYLCSADFALQEVESRAISSESSNIEHRPALKPSAATSDAKDVALVARAEQKIHHSVDLLNQAQQMIDGERTVWGMEIHHGAIWHK